MQTAKAWLKEHWKYISIAMPIIAIALKQFGILFAVNDGNLTVVIPVDDGPAIVQSADVKPVQGRFFSKYFYTLARVKAANQLSRDKSMSFVEAYDKVRKVPDADIEAAAKKAGIEPAQGLGDGSVLKKIIDWFSDPDNQAKLKALIEFIMALAMSFAQADPAATWSCSLSHWHC